MKLGDILILILLAVIVVLLSPIIIPAMLVIYLKERVDRIRFAGYLKANEGAKFFAYTNKQTSQAYVEKEILPLLPEGIQVIFLDGKGRINLGDDTKFGDRIVWSMKATKGGFPYVSKIVGGMLITESVNNRLYSAIKRGIGSEGVVKRIEKFLSSD